MIVGGADVCVCVALQQTLTTVACGCRVCVAGGCSALKGGCLFRCFRVLRKCWSICLLNGQWWDPMWHDPNRPPLVYSPLQKKSKGKKKKKGKKWVISSKALNYTADTQHRDGVSLFDVSIFLYFDSIDCFLFQFLCWWNDFVNSNVYFDVISLRGIT